MEPISKTKFKAHALEILREIEKSGKSRIITDRGIPKLEIRKLRQKKQEPLSILRNSVISFEEGTSPIADDDWENA